MLRKTFISLAAGALVLAIGAVPASAQGYPARPITILVPWAAGGGSDAMARTYGALLERDLKQPVSVVNRTGGNGVVGHQAIASAPPDGYTIGLATLEIAVFKSLGLADLTVENYTPIARIAAFDAAIVVRADAPYKTAAELRDAIRAGEEGKFKAGGSGQGGSWHMALGGWLQSEGIKPTKVRYVPSAGAAASLQELAAGGIDFATCSAVEARALAEAGRLRVLAVMGDKRLDFLPDVPTLKEATGSPWAMASWFAIVGPKGMDPTATKVLAEATKRVHDTEEFRKFLKDRSFNPVWEAGTEFTAFAGKTTTDLAAVLAALELRK